MSKTGKRRKTRKVSSSSSDGNEREKASREKDVTSHRKRAKKRHREKSQERTMSKKGKRKKTRKLSSSSNDGNERDKASQDKDVISHRKRAKKRHREKSQERYAEKPEISASPAGKDGSQSDRLIKKSVYKLPKVQPTDKKPARKEDESTKTETVFVPSYIDNCDGKAIASKKDTIVSVRHTVERGSSKQLRTDNTGAGPQMIEKTRDESSPRSHSRLKDRISSDSEKQKDHRWMSVKRSSRSEAPQRAEKDSNAIKSRETRKSSSHSKESPREKKREHQDNVKAKISPCRITKIPCSTAEKDSSAIKSRETGKSPSQSKETLREKKREHQENVKAKISPCTITKIPWGTTENDSSAIKSSQTGKSPSQSKESPREKKREHQEDVKAKISLCTTSKRPYSTATEQACTSEKTATSDSMGTVLTRFTPVPGHATPAPQKIASYSPTVPLTFKIAKKPRAWLLYSPVRSKEGVSTNKHVKRATEPSASGASVDNTKLVPHVQHTTDFTPSVSSERQDRTSSLADQVRTAKQPQAWSLYSPVRSREGVSTDKHVKHATEPSASEASVDNTKRGLVPHVPHSADFTPSVSSEQDGTSSLADQVPSLYSTSTLPWHVEMQVAEELHLARYEKRLEVNVNESYGELTCMDIDPPEEGATESLTKKPLQQDLLLVLDTNILLSHLDYVKAIKAHGLGALGFPVVLIPWVVLQELDSLKRAKNVSGSVAHLATPAISFIYNSLKEQDPHLLGQSMQQATESRDGLTAENNDDRVLQCCLQYQRLYPECALILCTNDKNLCSKALLSGVKALSKDDLVAEVGKARCGLTPHAPILPHCSFQVPMSSLSRGSTRVTPQSQDGTALSLALTGNENNQLCEGANHEKTSWELSLCLSELRNCLRDVLSAVLEAEMKAVYEDLWLEIVCVKPPWTLQDILHCLKKHWIAVIGQIVPRNMLQIVLNLIEFFTSDKRVERSATVRILLEAKELLQAFGKRSVQVSSAVSVLDNIFHRLQPQGESHSPACDVIMNDDEDKDPTSCLVSNHEVWSLFENIWTSVCQTSLEVFKALGFDPNTMQSALPAGRPPPQQDALACLHKLCSVVSQLLQAFSSVLSSSTSGLEEVQTLLNIIQSTKIVPVELRLTAKDLLDCFLQEDYRERLRVGGTQLMELKMTLQRCVEAAGQRSIFTASL